MASSPDQAMHVSNAAQALQPSNADTYVRTYGLRTASPSREISPLVTRGRTYDDSPFPWPYSWQRTLWSKPAHTCPDCRRIVVRTDGHHCPEEER